MAKKLSGGGLSSNKLVRVGLHAGPASTNKINPAGVSQFGYATGSRINKEHGYGTENSAVRVNAGTMSQVPLGNAVAGNVKGGGPGTGRTVYRSAQQGTHGPVAGPAPVQGRDIFAQFPPEQADKSSLVRTRR
jgi:hypothetical protein